jgi:predicted nucleic acid-binding protein
LSQKYLLDASALYPLILKLREKIFTASKKLAVLDLTYYEVGNILWKHYKRGKIANLDVAAEIFKEILDSIEKFKAEDFIGTLKTATKENLTFYDATYIQTAEKQQLTLVSADKQILRKYSKAILPEKMEV